MTYEKAMPENFKTRIDLSWKC